MGWEWSRIDWPQTLAVGVGIAAMVQGAVAVLMMRGLRHSARAVQAAHDTLDFMRGTAQLQFRAYVGVTKTEFSGFREGRDAVACIHLKNSGLTPAVNLRVKAEVGTTPREIYEDLPDINLSEVQPITINVERTTTLVLTSEVGRWKGAIDKLKAGELQFFVKVRFEYEDVFGASHGEDCLLLCRDPQTHAEGEPLIIPRPKR